MRCHLCNRIMNSISWDGTYDPRQQSDKPIEAVYPRRICRENKERSLSTNRDIHMPWGFKPWHRKSSMARHWFPAMLCVIKWVLGPKRECSRRKKLVNYVLGDVARLSAMSLDSRLVLLLRKPDQYIPRSPWRVFLELLASMSKSTAEFFLFKLRSELFRALISVYCSVVRCSIQHVLIGPITDVTFRGYQFKVMEYVQTLIWRLCCMGSQWS